MAKENKKGGVATTIIMGAGMLVIVAIIVLVIVSTMEESNLLRSTATTSYDTDNNTFLNDTGHSLSEFAYRHRAYTIVSIVNASSGTALPSANWSFTAASGIIKNGTSLTYNNVNITYSYIKQTSEENSSSQMIEELSGGVDNVSAKIPTVLLLVAVIVLFGVIYLLAKKAGEMGFLGNSGSL